MALVPHVHQSERQRRDQYERERAKQAGYGKHPSRDKAIRDKARHR